jgi:hypothetical protein
MLKDWLRASPELGMLHNMLFRLRFMEASVTPNSEHRIWFHPPKFWAATNHLRKEEADELLNRVLRMAENSEVDRLRQFSFISVGKPGTAREN